MGLVELGLLIEVRELVGETGRGLEGARCEVRSQLGLEGYSGVDGQEVWFRDGLRVEAARGERGQVIT